MSIKRLLIVLFFLFSLSIMQGKDIVLQGKGKKLNVLLNELAERYDLLISFNDTAMAAIKLNEDKNFKDVNGLFAYLQRQHYIKIDTIGNSFVLSRMLQKRYTYHGKVIDALSREALPNAEIVCDDFHTYSNSQGYFTFLSSEDAPKSIEVRHLGYLILDTVIYAKTVAQIPLKSYVQDIDNVVVSSQMKSYNVHIGSCPGGLKLTPEFVSKLPGYGESSMYSFLKLMPGVLATGESSNDMSLRGSSEGQNLYIFDNYRVYNPWYRLSEIGTVNPLLVKDVEVYKSGMDVSVGEHVGGVVLLKGIDAVPKRAKGAIFINNFVGNLMLQAPLNAKTSVVLSARRNIKEQLELPDAIGNYVIKDIFEGFANNYQVNVTPTYKLYDGNFKLIYKPNENSKFTVSGFGSLEKNKLDNTTLTDIFKLKNKQKRNSKQYATALHYTTYSPKGKQLELTASYSSIETEIEGDATLLRLDKEPAELYETQNEESGFLQEFRLKAKRRTPFPNGGYWEYGLGFTGSSTKEAWQKKTKEWLQEKWHQLSYIFLNANFSLSPKWNVNVGGRLSYFHALEKLSIEPRFVLSYYPDNQWKLYGSYGTFQQFVYPAHVFDRLQNIRYRRVSAGKDIPVLTLNDLCVGVRYANPKWTLSAELFCKYTDDRIRATSSDIGLSGNTANSSNIAKEKLRYLGGDLLVKYQHEGFISWLSFTMTDFSVSTPEKEQLSVAADATVYTSDFNKSFRFGFDDNAYEHSNYDMRQELKWAAAYTWQKLTFSASYVYGSGFKLWKQPSSEGAPDYSRFDVGVYYTMKLKKANAELGCSVLNVLNRKNKKLDEFSRFGVGDDIVSYNTYGLRLTPAFFVKISF